MHGRSVRKPLPWFQNGGNTAVGSALQARCVGENSAAKKEEKKTRTGLALATHTRARYYQMLCSRWDGAAVQRAAKCSERFEEKKSFRRFYVWIPFIRDRYMRASVQLACCSLLRWRQKKTE